MPIDVETYVARHDRETQLQRFRMTLAGASPLDIVGMVTAREAERETLIAEALGEIYGPRAD